MVDRSSDSDGSDKFEWESDGEAEPSSAPALRNLDAAGPSTLRRQEFNGWANGEAPSSSLVQGYVGMGFTKDIVIKAIKEIGHSDANALLELLLTYKTLDDEAAGNCSTSGIIPQSVEDDDDLDFENWDGDDDADGKEPNSGGSGDEVSGRCFDSFGGRKKERLMEESNKKRKRYEGGAQGSRAPFDGNQEEQMPLPNPMVGFNLPSDRLRSVVRRLPKPAIGPPFFYFENVARAPKRVWMEISRFLYDIQPEFVDSKFFCAAARERGYIHNLPVENRLPLHPLPPKTILEAFPHYKNWWPYWDSRKQFDSLQTYVASPNVIKQIERALASSSDPPPLSVQKYVIDECRKWNLVWVGKNKVASLEQDEMEYIHGFPRNYTRGVANRDRYRCLGNSFQVDTVGYHLSVLKDMFPNGVNVLSLFTGIGGGEVALHRLGIHIKTVVSVEIDDVSRRILKGWWDQTQTGTLIQIADVKSLTNDRITSFIDRFGRFDLVIGGLEGEQSTLLYHYSRILKAVKPGTVRM